MSWSSITWKKHRPKIDASWDTLRSCPNETFWNFRSAAAAIKTLVFWRGRQMDEAYRRLRWARIIDACRWDPRQWTTRAARLRATRVRRRIRQAVRAAGKD